MSRGLLLTMTEPPAAMEEEFNAWYDEEHLAERLAIPGFLNARRWVADVKPGEGKYLGTYDLESPGVLASEKYLERFNHQTPWSRRCLGKAVLFRRWACEQLQPGDALTRPHARSLWLGLGDERPAAGAPGRLFHDPAGRPRYALLVEDADHPPTIASWVFRRYRAYTPPQR